MEHSVVCGQRKVAGVILAKECLNALHNKNVMCAHLILASK
jgi:hypothetical protein